MISLTASYSGSQIGSELLQDSEECSLSLLELASMDQDDINELSEQIQGMGSEDSKKIAVWLYQLAEAVNNKED